MVSLALITFRNYVIFLKLNSNAFQEKCAEFFHKLESFIKLWIKGNIGFDFGGGLKNISSWGNVPLIEFKNPSQEFQV